MKEDGGGYLASSVSLSGGRKCGAKKAAERGWGRKKKKKGKNGRT